MDGEYGRLRCCKALLDRDRAAQHGKHHIGSVVDETDVLPRTCRSCEVHL